jgi:hypothetical protein
MHEVLVDGLRIAYADVGAGPPLAVIPGGGHVSNAEAPGEFNAHVREFLRRLGLRGGPDRNVR